MSKTYRISNGTGAVSSDEWLRSFPTRAAAASALMRLMGWETIALSVEFCAAQTPDGQDVYAVCAYETSEERNRDDEGAHAPRITEWPVVSTCAACGKRFEASGDGDDCTTCGAGPICTDCWGAAGKRCGEACAATSSHPAAAALTDEDRWEMDQAERLSARKNGDDLS